MVFSPVWHWFGALFSGRQYFSGVYACSCNGSLSRPFCCDDIGLKVADDHQMSCTATTAFPPLASNGVRGPRDYGWSGHSHPDQDLASSAVPSTIGVSQSAQRHPSSFDITQTVDVAEHTFLSSCDDPVLVTREFNPSSEMLRLRDLMILAPFYHNDQRSLGRPSCQDRMVMSSGRWRLLSVCALTRDIFARPGVMWILVQKVGE